MTPWQKRHGSFFDLLYVTSSFVERFNLITSENDLSQAFVRCCIRATMEMYKKHDFSTKIENVRSFRVSIFSKGIFEPY